MPAPRISGFTFVRNGVKFDFPLLESIRSLLPLVDELVVLVGKGEDDTLARVKSITDPKIKIFESVWDEKLRKNGAILAQQTDLAMSYCTGDWGIYLQADEVLHEDDYPAIREAITRANTRSDVDGLLFDYVHFYADYFVVNRSPSAYRHEIRAIRLGRGIVSWKDAQGFRTGIQEKLRVIRANARIFHYGWVRPPEVMKEKTVAFDKLFHGDAGAGTGDNYKYKRIYGLERFTGTHPAVMLERVAEKRWKVDLMSFPLSWEWKDARKVLARWVEKLTGRLPFQYRNYIKIGCLLFVSLAAHGAPLELAQEGAKVTITDPRNLVDKAVECKKTFIGYGFSIDWGDGSQPKGDCVAGSLEHVYTVPGDYVVKAKTEHLGPTDAAIADWEATGSVSVKGKADDEAFVVLRSFPRELHYGTGFPPLRVTVKTGKPRELVAELLAGDKVLFSARRSVSFSGDTTIGFPDYGNGPPASAYRNGAITARVRIKFGKSTASSGPFRLLASATFRPLTLQALGALKAEGSVQVHHRDCYSYLVSWGDGTPADRAFPQRKSCPLAADTVKLSHTYSRAGTYVVRWNDNDGEPLKPAEAGPGYLEGRVKVLK